eukprot:SAG11_NODE_3458_length_2436_cov_1.462559_3_plen_151_part_00
MITAGQQDLLDLVEDAVRVTQDNDAAVVYGLAAARLLGAIIAGEASAAEAAAALPAMLRAPARAAPQPDDRHVANRLDAGRTLSRSGTTLLRIVMCYYWLSRILPNNPLGCAVFFAARRSAEDGGDQRRRLGRVCRELLRRLRPEHVPSA